MGFVHMREKYADMQEEEERMQRQGEGSGRVRGRRHWRPARRGDGEGTAQAGAALRTRDGRAVL